MIFSQISLTRHFIVMISQDYLELLNCLVRLMMRDSLHVFICVMGVLDFLPSPQAIYKRTQRHTPLVFCFKRNTSNAFSNVLLIEKSVSKQ